MANIPHVSRIPPGWFWDHVTSLVAAVGSAAATIFGVLNRNKIQEIRVSVDGKMAKLLEQTEIASHAAGRREGVESHEVDMNAAIGDKAAADNRLASLKAHEKTQQELDNPGS